MKWPFQIGKLFGIPIKVHATFLLLLFFIGILGSRQAGASGAIFGMVSIAFIFLCVVLHEIRSGLLHLIVCNFYWLLRGAGNSLHLIIDFFLPHANAAP